MKKLELKREKGKREKRISNIEQGISNDEVRNGGSLPNACRDSGKVRTVLYLDTDKRGLLITDFTDLPSEIMCF